MSPKTVEKLELQISKALNGVMRYKDKQDKKNTTFMTNNLDKLVELINKAKTEIE